MRMETYYLVLAKLIIHTSGKKESKLIRPGGRKANKVIRPGGRKANKVIHTSGRKRKEVYFLCRVAKRKDNLFVQGA